MSEKLDVADSGVVTATASSSVEEGKSIKKAGANVSRKASAKDAEKASAKASEKASAKSAEKASAKVVKKAASTRPSASKIKELPVRPVDSTDENTPRKAPLRLKVTEFDFALADISAGLIPSGMSLPERTYWASCTWMPGESPEQRVAGLTVNTRLDWEGGLLITLKYIVEFIADAEIPATRLEKAIHEILTPVWNDAAYVTSFITDRFVGMPIIVPPQVEVVEFE